MKRGGLLKIDNKRNINRLFKYLFIILINVLFYINTFHLYENIYKILGAIIITSILDVLLLKAINGKFLKGIIFILISLFKLALNIYYINFGNLNIFERRNSIKELTGVMPVIKEAMNCKNIFLIVILVLALYIIFKDEKELKKTFKYKFVFVVSLIGLTFTIKPLLGTEAYLTTVYYPFSEMFFTKDELNDDEIENLKEEIQENSKKTNRFTGLTEDMNVIYIQCESLQNTFVNKKYNGEEITPFLNQLIKSDGSIYFNNFFELTGAGNTSDAEWVSTNGIYPTREGQAYSVYKDKQNFGLAKELKKYGYKSLVFHGNTGEFYDRRELYPLYGYDKLYFGEEFDQDEQLIMGLSDGSFFRQIIPVLDEYHKNDEKFFAMTITLTTHTPFNLEKEYREIPPKAGEENDFVYNYANCARYTDNALKEFFENLEEKGILDNTMIVLYGDHHAFSMTNREYVDSVEKWLGREIYFDDMMNIPLLIRLPNLEENIVRENIGSHLDIYPTVLNLLGVNREHIPLFGIDLLNDDDSTENNTVLPQSYMLEGSFINKETIFEISRDNIFSNSKFIDRHNRKLLDVNKAEDLSEKAMGTIRYSNKLMNEDRINEILLKGVNKIEPEKIIAHGGGSVNGHPMTNTINGLDGNYNRGVRLFEIDFAKTLDGKYIGLHGWDGYLSRYIDITVDEAKEPMNYQDILDMEVVNGWELINFDNLTSWLDEHEDAKIITDTKGDNIELLKYIKTNYGEIMDNLIVQIYLEEEYETVKELGYRGIIYTLYKIDGNVDEVIKFSKENELYGITLSNMRIEKGDWHKLLEIDTPIFIHTINDYKRAEELFDKNVDKIYSDFL